MTIPKMCLKKLFSHFKWVLQAISSLSSFQTVFLANSNFDTAFLPDCTQYCSVFSGYQIGNLMRIPKLCVKQSFSYYKWVWQAL